MSRARFHSAALVPAVLLAVLLAVPISAASTGHGRPTSASANQLLRRFPLGKRQLCCTTSGSHAVSPPSHVVSSGGAAGPAGSSRGGAKSGHGLSMLGLLAVAVALLVVGLDLLVARARRTRRRRLGTRSTAEASGEAAHRLVVRTDAGRRAPQLQEPQPIDEPTDRPQAAPATATNGQVTERKHVSTNRADAPNTGEVVVRRWRQNPVGAEDAAPAPRVRNPVPESAPVASAEPDSANSTATTAGGVPGPDPADRPVMPAEDRAPRHPGDVDIAAKDYELALGLHERGELEAAAVAYRRAELRGEPEAAFNLGVLLYESGDHAGAEDTWRRCLAYQHARAATNLGFLLEERGDVRRALLAYSAAERWGDPQGRILGAALLRSVKGPRHNH